jgi:signal transduction histidine kinase
MRARLASAARTLLFVLAAIPVGAAALAVLVAGWTLGVCLAITPLVLPVLVGFRAAVGGVAWLDAELANALLGTRLRPSLAPPPRRGFWGRCAAVLEDAELWRQQVYLLLRCVLGWALAVLELTLLAAGVLALATPFDYSFSDAQIGSWQVDTLGRALLFVPAGAAALLLALWLLRPLRSLWLGLASALLGAPQAAPAALPGPARAGGMSRRRALALHVAGVVALGGLFVLIWALTSRSYFWPVWPLLVLGLSLAIHAWVVLVLERPDLARRARSSRGIVIHAGVSLALAAFLTGIWAASSRGYFWPVWPILVLGAVFLGHLAVERARGEDRIAELETTRAGAIDQQEAELRRIERDLHDGAQARLVALGMSIGMAEQKLASDPAAAQALLAEARQGAHEALEELRDLARGIHPPVLADRGLAAAVEALAGRSPLRVEVAVDLPRRPPPAVESAAYFVVAESLANTGKHAAAGHVDVRVREERGKLVVEVVDDGRGGADPAGGGLRGLARRVEALDGTLEVSSPAGGPTRVRAVMPCGS